ncbi:MAG: hypothetical protein ACJ72N_18970 [Labedaea sp.]
MTERTRSSPARPAQGREPEETAEDAASSDASTEPRGTGWAGVPIRLRVALPVALLGAALTVLGPVLGLVDHQPAAGFAALPLLIVLAALAPVAALAAIVARRPVLAAGVLIGSALLAPGRALTDLQFARDALLTARPELMAPTNLAALSPSAGLWVLILGHLAIGAAGLLAAGSAGAEPGSAYAAELEETGETLSVRRYLMGWAFVCATVAAVGLLRPSYRSHNAFQLAREVFDSPALVRGGGLLIVAAVVLGCVFAATSTRPVLARGLLLGLLAAVAGVTVPGIVAGLSVDRLEPAFGPYLALVAVAVLAAVIFLLPRPGERDADAHAEVTLEASRLHLAAGALGVLAGLAALGGGIGRQLIVDSGLDQPASFANRQLIPAGLLVGLLGATLLVRRWATAVRPAFTVALAAVPVVGAGTLDAAFTGVGVSPAVHIGAGVWFTGIAMFLAVLAAACAGVAGSAERDDVDLTERGVNRAVLIPAVAAMVLALGAFALPAVKAADFVAPGLYTQFRLASWGLVLGLVVVIAAGALAPVSRPARAAALLFGATGVVGVHLLEFPLTKDRADDAVVGPGTWLSLACVAALVVAAVVAVVTHPRQR